MHNIASRLRNISSRHGGGSSQSGAVETPAASSTSSSASSSATAGSSDGGGGRISAFARKRLEKERREMLERPVESVKLMEDQSTIDQWHVEIRGAPETIYAGEIYRLRFRFPESYPLDSPEVVFIGPPPEHPHIYSNGHICLSILYDAWSPALGVSSVCLSLISMLSSCDRKCRPPDDLQYTALSGRVISPKSMRWVFHDDTV